MRDAAMPVGRVLALVGGLAIVAAYAMPWFSISMGSQGVSLSGLFLGRFLASTPDLGRVMPGFRGGPEEVGMLRALVLFFPAAGAVAALLSAGTAFATRRRLTSGLLVAVGLAPLVAVAGGLSQLPPGASPEVGLWTIGIGAAAVILGAGFDLLAARRQGSLEGG